MQGYQVISFFALHICTAVFLLFLICLHILSHQSSTGHAIQTLSHTYLNVDVDIYSSWADGQCTARHSDTWLLYLFSSCI